MCATPEAFQGSGETLRRVCGWIVAAARVGGSFCEVSTDPGKMLGGPSRSDTGRHEPHGAGGLALDPAFRVSCASLDAQLVGSAKDYRRIPRSASST